MKYIDIKIAEVIFDGLVYAYENDPDNNKFFSSWKRIK
jgi:hypothetical protein